jgi:tRNA pseudouridine38-40 synthase
MRYFFRVEYDGSLYGGWQKQHNAASIQAHIEKAFTTVLRKKCAVTGAGRTDAGVHARAQGAHVEIDTHIDDPAKCQTSVNAVLPADIAIYGMKPVADDFHARFSAVRRKYRYYMADRKSPLHRDKAWCLWHRPDWQRIRDNCALLKGSHDFRAFCSTGTATTNMRCTVYDAALASEDGLFVFSIEADRFIYKMVRSLVGTLVDIGRGRISESIDAIIASGDRKRVGETAPAWGLVLDYVFYPGDL